MSTPEFDPLEIARRVAVKRGLIEPPKPPTIRDLMVPAEEVEIAEESGVKIPDYTEVMVGWRAWNVHPNTLQLGSATHGDIWQPREAMEATCRGKYICAKTGDVIPGGRCGCGLYAAKTLEHLQSMGYHSYYPDRGSWTVVGPVALWGKVIEGSQGWRAQYGYPQKLYVPFEGGFKWARALSEKYGVPVELKNYLKED